MKRLLGMLTVILMIGTSQASTNLIVTQPNGKGTVIVTQRQTAIRSVQGHANIPRISKPKLFTGKPHKVSANDWDEDFLDDDDILTGYRRRDVNKIEHPEGLSEKVRWRLFLARQLAMLKYKQLHG